MRTLDFIEQDTLRRDLPPFRVGDAVRVHATVREGEKERTQVFEGVVIRRKGAGAGETFTVRKIASGVGVERIFPIQSPLITKVEIKNRGYVRRSKLYYLRELTGKKARLKSKVRDLSDVLSPEAAEAANAASATDEQMSAPAVEVAAEATEEAGGKKLKGKDRKKQRAAEKKVRMAELENEAGVRAKAKAEAEAKAAKEAEAEAAAAAKADADASGDAAEETTE